jgi:hypothetical protein
VRLHRLPDQAGVLQEVTRTPEAGAALEIVRAGHRLCDPDRPLVVGTGHRPPRLGLYYTAAHAEHLFLFVKPHLARLNPRLVVSGMAQGFDQALAEAAQFLGIPVWAALPFEGQDARWPADARRHYQNLLRRSDRVVTVCPAGGPTGRKFIERDRFMVDLAAADPNGMVLALFDGAQEGGTWATVEYALSRPVRVLNLFERYAAPLPV